MKGGIGWMPDSKPVRMLDWDSGRCLNEFYSMGQAESRTGILRSNISAIAHGIHQNRAMYRGRWVTFELIDPADEIGEERIEARKESRRALDKERGPARYLENKEEIDKKHQEYYRNNRKFINKRNKEYYDKNKAQINKNRRQAYRNRKNGLVRVAK